MSALEKYYHIYKNANNQPPTEIVNNNSQDYINLLIKRALLFGLLGGGLAALSPVLMKYLEKQPINVRDAILRKLPTGLGLGALAGIGEATLENLNNINYAINTGQMDKSNLPPAILEALKR